MTYPCSGGFSPLKCTENRLPEFPNLLFGTSIDGSSLFDATLYLSSLSDSSKTIDGFQQAFEFQINAIFKTYKIKAESAFIINDDKHVLIDEYLCYSFLSYVEPDFLAWTYERVSELMHYGISVSDSFLMKSVSDRFSPEVIKNIIKQL